MLNHHRIIISLLPAITLVAAGCSTTTGSTADHRLDHGSPPARFDSVPESVARAAATPKSTDRSSDMPSVEEALAAAPDDSEDSELRLTSASEAVVPAASEPPAEQQPRFPSVSSVLPSFSQDLTAAADDRLFLATLEQQALDQNPRLKRAWQQLQATRSRTRYIAALPDPKLAANVFAAPIETAAGSQQANLSISQLLPSLRRLNAVEQAACFDALAQQQVYLQQRLKVVADLRTAWYRLFVLHKQLQAATATQQLLQDLIDVSNADVATGRRPTGDVLLATVEYGRITDRQTILRQQIVSTTAELNRLAGRPADADIPAPSDLQTTLPDQSLGRLQALARRYQPAIEAARIRTQATRWGIEVARLNRRPEVGLNATWFAIDDNRPASPVVDVGDDAWSIGAQVSLPLRDAKYRFMQQEAQWKHAASAAAVEQAMQHFDALVLDLREQARAAQASATLYQSTMLPQARQTLEVDQQAYGIGTIEFDRVIRDVQTVLTLEVDYYQALGRMATALARLEQAVGRSLSLKADPAR